MSANRGILYVVWGDKANSALERSVASVRTIYPQMPIHIARGKTDVAHGLAQKAQMADATPFETTLYLDADTIVLGNLDHAFAKTEAYGLACCINECPWMRRYGRDEGDRIEYNTGVIFFTARAKPVFNAWQRLVSVTPAKSHWLTFDGQSRGLDFEDQASFAHAIEQTNFNPFVLPPNYNFRPNFHRSFFAPIKIWHEYHDVLPVVRDLSRAVEANEKPVTHVEFSR